MGVDLTRAAIKFRLEAWLVDRLHRRLRDGAAAHDVHQRVELLCLAVVTRQLHHTMAEWIRRDRTPIDDAIAEADRRHPRWTRFDWDCDEAPHDWTPVIGDTVRVFTHAREFVGYAAVTYFGTPREGAEVGSRMWESYRLQKTTAMEFRFRQPPAGWALLPTGKVDLGRVVPE